MCDACKPLNKVYDVSQQLMVSRFNNAKTGGPTFILCQQKPKLKVESVTIEVRYCPWCGEELEGDYV